MELCEYAHTICEDARDHCYDDLVKKCHFYKKFKKEDEPKGHRKVGIYYTKKETRLICWRK